MVELVYKCEKNVQRDSYAAIPDILHIFRPIRLFSGDPNTQKILQGWLGFCLGVNLWAKSCVLKTIRPPPETDTKPLSFARQLLCRSARDRFNYTTWSGRPLRNFFHLKKQLLDLIKSSYKAKAYCLYFLHPGIVNFLFIILKRLHLNYSVQ